MADNVIANAGAGGATFRAFSDGTVDWPASVCAYVTGGSAGAWTLQQVDATHGLPVAVLGTVPVSGTFWQATQPVSAASLPVPAGAATAAKQPALGTAGAPSADALTVQGIASMTPLKVDGSAVTQPVSGTVTANQGGSNWTVNVAQVGGTAFALGQQLAAASLPVVLTAAQLSTLTPLSTVAATQSGTWNVGTVTTLTGITNNVTVVGTGTFAVQATQSGTWTVQPGNTANTTPWLTTEQPGTSGGLTPSKLVSAASVNATSVKASAGKLYDIFCTNINAAARYLKLYDKASAPTVGTDVPVWTLLIPGNTAGAGLSKAIPGGLQFSSGIALALTTGVTDADTGAVAANEIVVNLGYK